VGGEKRRGYKKEKRIGVIRRRRRIKVYGKYLFITSSRSRTGRGITETGKTD